MSLIQEALKRQQDDSGLGVSPVTPPPVQDPSVTQPPSEPSEITPPSLPPPLPSAPDNADESMAGEPEAAAPAPAVDEQPAASRRWPILLGVMAGILIVVGGAIWGGLVAYQKWQATETAVEPLPEKADAESSTSVDETDPGQTLQEDQVQKDPDTELDEDASSPTAEEEEPSITHIETVPETPSITHVESAVPLPEPNPVESKPPADWPSLLLTGILGKGDSGSAFLNNEVVSIDETIDGVRVLSIGQRGVELEYEGEIQFLKVGGSTQ